MLNDAQRCSRVIHGMMTWTPEATGEHLKEAIEINRSLTALGDVIEADFMGKTRGFPHGFHGFKQQNRSGVL